MPETYRSNIIAAPVGKVWSVVRQFDGLPLWHPAIAGVTALAKHVA